MDELRLIIYKEDGFDYSIEDTFFDGSGLTHAQNLRYKLLPFTATGRDFVTDFTGVVGSFVRYMGNKSLKSKFSIDDFYQELDSLISSTDEKESLLRIVKSIYIDGDQLVMFNLHSYNYVKASNNQSKIAFFLYSMFVDENLKGAYNQLVTKNDSNVLHKLVLDSLPKLITKTYDEEAYECLLPYVKEVFTKDFEYMLQNSSLVEKSVKRFLEYYYMFYITQLSVKLNRFENADRNAVEKIYMTLSWEVTSKTRRSYDYGWTFVKENVEKLFSHAITLEILAHNSSSLKFDYLQLNEVSKSNDRLVNNLNEFIKEYKNRKLDVDFSAFKKDDSKNGDSKVLNKIRELVNIIDYQFRNSKRRTQNARYNNNLVKFVEQNFGKRRGSLGYSFNITENDIILFVQIIIGLEGGRIRLNDLFVEFEKRGLIFDRESKRKIVELLEKLNLLEKKSDSGDAQYVRSIL